jgi:hypothetical protein
MEVPSHREANNVDEGCGGQDAATGEGGDTADVVGDAGKTADDELGYNATRCRGGTGKQGTRRGVDAGSNFAGDNSAGHCLARDEGASEIKMEIVPFAYVLVLD